MTHVSIGYIIFSNCSSFKLLFKPLISNFKQFSNFQTFADCLYNKENLAKKERGMIRIIV